MLFSDCKFFYIVDNISSVYCTQLCIQNFPNYGTHNILPSNKVAKYGIQVPAIRETLLVRFQNLIIVATLEGSGNFFFLKSTDLKIRMWLCTVSVHLPKVCAYVKGALNNMNL